MRHALALCFLILLLSPESLSAQTEERIPVTDAAIGMGDVPIEPLDVRDATHALPMSRLGADVFRFTDGPAICGRAYSFEAVRRSRDAIFRVVWLYGCARTGLRVTRHETFRLSLDEYDYLAEWVDAQMERGRAIATATGPN